MLRTNIVNLLMHAINKVLMGVGLRQSKLSEEDFRDIYNNVLEQKNTRFIGEVEEYFGNKLLDTEIEFIDTLAFHTQLPQKKTEINWHHGYLLSLVINKLLEKKNNLTVLDVGTARGFSSICMLNSIKQNEGFGKVITVDIIPNRKKIFWNTINDAKKRTRLELLQFYSKLIAGDIIFFNGTSKMAFNFIDVVSIDFAFVDGSHFYSDVLFELEWITKRLTKGGYILCDDYDENFQGVVRAVKEISSKYNLKIKVFSSTDKRGYALLNYNAD